MNRSIALAALAMTVTLSGQRVWSNDDLQTVPYVDPTQYIGRWYQQARNVLPFEPQDCVCAQQTLGIAASGNVSVYNSCNVLTPRGDMREIRGEAINLNPGTNTKFKVDFGFPKKGDYWIIGLAEDYRWAVVSDPARTSLYILSKTPVLAPELYNLALAEAAKQIDTSKLKLTSHEGCVYPAAQTQFQTQALPAAPTEPSHPGSKVYEFGVQESEIKCNGRAVQVFLPTSPQGNIGQKPVIVYGHGQALDVSSYRATLQHLAKKGFPAIHPIYDTGFFDQDWTRMGQDYISLTDCALKQFPTQMDPNRVIFSGHSKGAYVASIAAGLAFRGNGVKPASVMLFNAAGADTSTLGSIGADVPLTVIFSDKDTIVEENLSRTIFQRAGSSKRQYILLRSYTASQGGGNLNADHMWPLTKKGFGGGGPESAFHYFGSWKWLTAAAMDLAGGSRVQQPHLYGELAGHKGVSGFQDNIERTW